MIPLALLAFAVIALVSAELAETPAPPFIQAYRTAIAVPPVPVPERGDWSALSDGQRAAVARTFGYEGPVRDGLFARYLDIHPDKRADFRARFVPAPSPPPPPLSPAPPSPVPVSASPPERGEWSALNDDQRMAVARTYGYDGPVRDGLFARYLEAHPEKKSDFTARFVSPAPPSSPPSPSPAAPAISAPRRGNWSALSEGERTAVARTYGYDGPVRDGLFARFLEAHPEKKLDFTVRFVPPAPPSSPPSPSPAAPAISAPRRGNWSALSEGERTAVARTYGYDGPVRDGLFARYLEVHPEKKADFIARFMPTAGVASAPTAASSEPLRSTGSSSPGPASSAPLPSAPLPSIRGAVPPPPAKPLPPAPPRSEGPSPSSPIRTPSAAPSSPTPAAIAGGRYVVQAGTYRDPANAEAVRRRLAAKGYAVSVADWVDGRGRQWRVVRVGGYDGLEEARRVAAALGAQGIAAQVHRLR